MLQSQARALLVIFLSVCLIFFHSFVAYADDIYSWQDSSGVIVFGENPPANARSLKRLSQRPLSRYSSDKIISGFRVKPKSSEENNASSLQGSLRQENFSYDPTRSRLDSKSPKKAGGKNGILKSARLSYQDPSVQTNERGEVISCSVTLKNEGAVTASKISVQLTFPDGSFLSTIGPDKLEPTREGIYGIPSSSLPLKLNLGNSPKPEEVKPEVLLSYE